MVFKNNICCSSFITFIILFAPLQFLWHFKLNLTKGDQFLEAAEKLCADQLKSLDECKQSMNVKGHKLSCLMENSDSIGPGLNEITIFLIGELKKKLYLLFR